MEHPFKVVEASHDSGKRDHDQRKHERGFSPAVRASPQCESKNETGKSCNERAERSALPQRHRDEKCGRRRTAKRLNNKSGNEEQNDAAEGAERKADPELAGLALALWQRRGKR